MITKTPASFAESIPAERALFEPAPTSGAMEAGVEFARVMDQTLNQRSGQSGGAYGKSPKSSSQSDAHPVNSAKRKSGRDDSASNKGDSDPSAAAAATSAAATAQTPAADADDASSQNSHEEATDAKAAAGTTANGAAVDAKTPGVAGNPTANTAANLASLLTAAGQNSEATAGLTQAAENSALSPPKSDGSESAISQAADLQSLVSKDDGAAPAIGGGGIGSALDRERMKFDAQKNEFAGRGEQKLPRTPVKGDSSSDASAKIEVKSDATVSELKKEMTNPVIPNEALPKFGEAVNLHSDTIRPTVEASGSVMAERVGRMVSDEVVVIRQSGASNLAVSLKVDAHTEVFLQLASRDGQIQASIRCERGDLGDLNQHWGQLQQSLARQNVQLMPLEEQSGTRNSTQNPFSGNANSSHQNQSGRGEQRQARSFADEMPGASPAPKASRSRTAKTKTPAPDGWESWA